MTLMLAHLLAFTATYGRLAIAALVFFVVGALVVILCDASRGTEANCDPIVLSAMRERRRNERHERQRP